MDKLIQVFETIAHEMTYLPLDWDEAINKAFIQNPWFTEDNIRYMLQSIAKGYLNIEELELWRIKYAPAKTPKYVALIMAGNIPLAGFHDFLCVLMSGHHIKIKLSSQDNVLLPFIVQRLAALYPDMTQKIAFVDKVVKPDAIIATGSNNSARYFEYYFAKYPHIIRKNRNSIAVLSGLETDADLAQLSNDIFLYFGLGCRSVSTLLLPNLYPLDKIFVSTHKYQHYINHNKYKNNFDYHVALYLLQKADFLTNNLIIMKENKNLGAPVGVLNYFYYSSINEVNHFLLENSANIQCVASKINVDGFNTIPFGQSQWPYLNDFADDINTMQFLASI